ncbi:helix-turn-helix domain-containing protein [Nocardioides pelophilus]|uniref:helix-turn-helix domain-containing protein n=1 Tax=Nocardioides pelophilus TaxID=2172019 RepID=UPI0016027D87|nr:helix-turn-helix transcriptional regulator [Nocardioides pelophilus]
MGEVIRLPDRPTARPAPLEPLWREAAGDELRQERHRAERTLTDVAQEAGISVQYLSEVERGLKEPSSEVLSAVVGALGLRLADLTLRVARRLHGPVCLAA